MDGKREKKEREKLMSVGLRVFCVLYFLVVSSFFSLPFAVVVIVGLENVIRS